MTMAATPEVKAKDRIKRELAKVLDARNLPHKLHWNGGAMTGTPRLDFDGVIAGHPFYIEVKRFDDKGKLSARQKLDMREYANAGAFSMLIDSEASLRLFLVWVQSLEPIRPISQKVLEALVDCTYR